MDLTLIYQQISTQVVNAEIRQADGDSGDSAQRDGFFYAITGLIDANEIAEAHNFGYEAAMKAHEVFGGYYRRTNNANHWGYSGSNCSRDQLSALRLAFAVQKDKKRLWQSLLGLYLRYGLHQNYKRGTDCSGLKCYKVPDFMHPQELAVFIRGLNLWALKPLLYILDLTFLGDLYFRKNSGDYDNMLVPQLAYANLKLSTPVSRFAWRLLDKEDALKKVERYHSVGPEKNGIRGYAELYKLLVQKVSTK